MNCGTDSKYYNNGNEVIRGVFFAFGHRHEKEIELNYATKLSMLFTSRLYSIKPR